MNSNTTQVWFNERGQVAFATTLNWKEVQGLYSGFSNHTCHYLGKVRDVLPQEFLVTAQDEFDDYVS